MKLITHPIESYYLSHVHSVPVTLLFKGGERIVTGISVSEQW